MRLWIQIRDHDDDVHFQDGSSYEVLPSGVLRIFSGSDVHLYSPAYWQQVTVDMSDSTGPDSSADVDDELRWQ